MYMVDPIDDYGVVPMLPLPLKSDGNLFPADRRGNIHRENAKNKFHHEHEDDFTASGTASRLELP